jgi:hypothetical protein
MLFRGVNFPMSEERERGPEIIEAHQEFVSHIEQGAGRMQFLSLVTVIVAGLLAMSYVLQLALPLTGTTSQTVNLTDPILIATELVVLGLTLVWLYVGISDLGFSRRMKREISRSRAKEREIDAKLG